MKTVRIDRIQIEHDSGKNLHDVLSPLLLSSTNNNNSNNHSHNFSLSSGGSGGDAERIEDEEEEEQVDRVKAKSDQNNDEGFARAFTHVDLNRAGTALLEIVTMPDLG